MSRTRGVTCRFCHSPMPKEGKGRRHKWPKVPCRRIQELENSLRMEMGHAADLEAKLRLPMDGAA